MIKCRRFLYLFFLLASPLAHSSQELLEAVEANDIERVRILLDTTSANYRSPEGVTPLVAAAQTGRHTLTRLLLENGADPNLARADGTTSLMLAAGSGKYSPVDQLIKKGADLEARNNHGLTAVMFAARYAPYNVWDIFLEAGADLKVRDSRGNTALIYAAYAGNLMSSKVLLRNEADIEGQNNVGDTALIWAARGGKESVLEFLIESGANVNHLAAGGRTALMVAAAEGHAGSVATLLKHGANKELKTDEGHTARMLAAENGHDKVVATIRFGEVAATKEVPKLAEPSSSHGKVPILTYAEYLKWVDLKIADGMGWPPTATDRTQVGVRTLLLNDYIKKNSLVGIPQVLESFGVTEKVCFWRDDGLGCPRECSISMVLMNTVKFAVTCPGYELTLVDPH